MHSTVLGFFHKHFPQEKQIGKTVLEVGSKFEGGGSLRDVFLPELDYVGLDMRAGPGVDVVSKLEDWEPGRTFDFVISAGTLEHCEDWRGVVNKMKEFTAPNGILVLTTVSLPFQRHGYPSDYWRFTGKHMEKIFSDMEILVLQHDEGDTDVFVIAKKTLKTGTTDLSKIEVDVVA